MASVKRAKKGPCCTKQGNKDQNQAKDSGFPQWGGQAHAVFHNRAYRAAPMFSEAMRFMGRMESRHTAMVKRSAAGWEA